MQPDFGATAEGYARHRAGFAHRGCDVAGIDPAAPARR